MKPTKCTNLLLRCLYYSVTQNTATCFDSQGTNFREWNQSNST